MKKIVARWLHEDAGAAAVELAERRPDDAAQVAADSAALLALPPAVMLVIDGIGRVPDFDLDDGLQQVVADSMAVVYPTIPKRRRRRRAER